MTPPPTTCGVVVCVYTEQRLQDIDNCLASLSAQTRRPDHTIVVVDHNPALLAALAGRVGDHVCVVPSRSAPGLSAARNTGLEVLAARLGTRDARSIVAVLDDDAVAEPDWLAELLAPFDAPDVVAVGGVIEPTWPTVRPPWFPPLLDWTVGCTNPRPASEQLELRNVFGASAAFRLAPLLDAGGFPEALGRRGDNGAGCEETEVCIRLRQQDPRARIVLAPKAVVHHRVTADRATVRYVLSRCYAEGTSKARLVQRVGGNLATSDERSAAGAAARAVLSDVVRRPRQPRRAAVLAGGFASAATGFTAATASSIGARALTLARDRLALGS